MFRKALLTTLLVTLPLVPLGIASAGDGQDDACTWTVSGIVDCAVTYAITILNNTRTMIQCILAIPPGQYPNGIVPCVITL